MKKKKLLRNLICLSIVVLSYSCSNNDDDVVLPIDDRSFIIDTFTDYFINKNGSVNISLSATYTLNSDFGNTSDIGFVYGTSTNPEVSTNNTAGLSGTFSTATGYVGNLTNGQTYFIRGYFKYDNGTFFYGDEIQVSTDIDASSERDVTLDIEPDAYLIQVDFITVDMNINNVIKEMPVEIGVEYSLNSNFSNSNRNSSEYFDGVHNKGEIVTTSYQVVAEPLQSGTTYYFRPFAKYADNTITNGGTSTASFTTN
jgi:hypothetical protein